MPIARRSSPVVPTVLVLLLAAVLPVTAGASLAWASDEAPLVDVLEQTRARHDVPAMGALALRGDEVREIAVAGLRKRDADGADGAVTADSLWHLGSCTKAITATMVARLVEQEIMRWDMTIGEVFPELAHARHAPGIRREYLPVTLEQLLTNRGGVPGSPGPVAWARAWKQEGTILEQRHAFMLDVLRLPPDVPVGQYTYSNQGFTIAGHMCERVSGLTWEQLVTREMFEPLGMTSAGFGAPGTRGDTQPVGHRADGTPADPKADNPPAISPAGRVHCRLEDWARFVAVHMNGSSSGKAYLSEDSYRRLHAPADGPGQRYAMGWNVADRTWGGTVLTHAGSNTMWYCVTWISPTRDLAVLVTCNQAGDAAVKACDEMAGAMIRRELSRRDAEASAVEHAAERP